MKLARSIILLVTVLAIVAGALHQPEIRSRVCVRLCKGSPDIGALIRCVNRCEGVLR